MEEDAAAVLFEGFYAAHVHRVFVVAVIKRRCVVRYSRGLL